MSLRWTMSYQMKSQKSVLVGVQSHICITQNWDLYSVGQQCCLYQLWGLFKLYKTVPILEEPHFRLLKQNILTYMELKGLVKLLQEWLCIFFWSKIWPSVMEKAVRLNSFQFNQIVIRIFFFCLCVWLSLTFRVYQVLTLKLTEI